MDGGVVAFVLAILVVAVLVFVAILLTGKRAHHFNVEQYQARMLAIENKLQKDNPATYVTSILNADKLLDKALDGRAGEDDGGKAETNSEQVYRRKRSVASAQTKKCLSPRTGF